MYASEIKMALPALYRERAEDAEEKAANALHPSIRSFCLELAHHWRGLADQAEHEAIDPRTWRVVRGLAQAAALNTPDGLEIW